MVLTIINKMGDKKRKGEGHRARLGAVDHLGLASTLMLYENVALATKKSATFWDWLVVYLKNTQTLQPIGRALKGLLIRHLIIFQQQGSKLRTCRNIKKSPSLVRCCEEFAKSADKEITRESACVSPSEKAHLFSPFLYLLLSR